MRAIWDGLEKLDQTLIGAAKKIETWRGKETFRARAEKSVKDVHPPQKAIQFDN